MRGDPDPRERRLDDPAQPARDPHQAEAGARRRARRLDGRHRRDRARRHHRRHRREPRRSSTPATGRCRSASSCPRASRADRGLIDVLKVPAKNGAAVPLVGGRRRRVRPGPDLDRPLRPRACASRSKATCAAPTPSARCIEAVMKLPTAKNLPPGVSIQPDRRRGGDGGGVRRLRQGHGRGHHDGARRAGPAVRELPAAVHHPAVAAALDRRRHPRRCSSRRRRSPAGGDRLPDADGHRHEERDHAGRLRGRGGREGRRPASTPSSTRAASAPGRSS